MAHAIREAKLSYRNKVIFLVGNALRTCPSLAFQDSMSGTRVATKGFLEDMCVHADGNSF